MTKDILLSIKGLQSLSEDQEDEVEVIIPGSYCKRGDMHYVKYDEVTEGFDGITSNLIKFSHRCFEVRKKGVTNTHMIFEKQKKNMTYYDTYALEINSEHLAECSIDVTVRPRNTGELHIV